MDHNYVWISDGLNTIYQIWYLFFAEQSTTETTTTTEDTTATATVDDEGNHSES